MGDETKTAEITAASEDGTTKVGWLELSDKERKIAGAVLEKTKSFLVSGFRDELQKTRAEWEKENATDPATRPVILGGKPDATDEAENAKFRPLRKSVVDKRSGAVIASADAMQIESRSHGSEVSYGKPEGGFMPPIDSFAQHGSGLTPDEKREYAEGFAPFVQELAKKGVKAGDGRGEVPFSILRFPKGDIDNFSMCRWAMALERSRNTSEGSLAYAKWAPWESAYYAALEAYAMSKGDSFLKAQGDMVSGQDGGFIAPELWATSLIDQIYPQMATSRLPITVLPMGTRVVHLPRLSANIQVNWAAENASLTANQAQFEQLSFTARKQAAFVQISNELIRDSAPTADTILRNNAAKYMAFDLDYQMLLGNGQSGTPIGLYNQTNVTKASGSNGGGFNGASAPAVVGSNSKYPLLDDFTSAIFNVEDLNNSTNVPIGQTNVTGILGAVALKLGVTAANDKAFSVTNGSARPNYGFGYQDMRWANRPDGSSALDGFLGVPTWVLSNIVKHALLAGSGGASAAPTTNASKLASPNTTAIADMNPVFFGDWQYLWLMLRQDVEVLASNVAGTAFQNDQTWIRLIRRGDVGVAHAQPFYVVTNG